MFLYCEFCFVFLVVSVDTSRSIPKMPSAAAAMLSKRVQHLAIQEKPTFMDSLDKIIDKIEIRGSDGAPRPIMLDRAVNKLITDLVNEKLQSEDIYATDTLAEYYDQSGIPKLKEAAAAYFTKYFHSAIPVTANDLCFVTSVNGCMDLLAHCLCDPGDVFLAFTPIFTRAPGNFFSRSKVEILYAPLYYNDSTIPFHLSVEKIEKSYEAAIQANKTVKGIFLINPGNPVGDIMSTELLMQILHFAAKHQLHVVVDEIYGLSVHSTNATFRSVISLPKLPDPQRTHMIYGLSKDFGLTAWRIGIIYSLNAELIKITRELSITQCLPLPIMEATTRVLSDHSWIDRVVDIMPKRAILNYQYVCDRLKGMDLLFREAPAALFVWVYLGSVMKEVTFKEEEALAKELQDRAYLYLTPGKRFFSSEPGWFRIVFTVPAEDLVEGMDRLEKYVQKLKLKKRKAFANVRTKIHGRN